MMAIFRQWHLSGRVLKERQLASPISLRPPDACHTLNGVQGMSMCLMPSTESASTMALTPADNEPTVPASPAPLTPSGLVGVGTGLSSITTLQILSPPAFAWE
jgi:hypothetical protein